MTEPHKTGVFTRPAVLGARVRVRSLDQPRAAAERGWMVANAVCFETFSDTATISASSLALASSSNEDGGEEGGSTSRVASGVATSPRDRGRGVSMSLNKLSLPLHSETRSETRSDSVIAI